MTDLVSECNVVSAVHSYVPVPVTCNCQNDDLVSECNVSHIRMSLYIVTVRMADLVSECNVVSAVHSYVL